MMAMGDTEGPAICCTNQEVFYKPTAYDEGAGEVSCDGGLLQGQMPNSAPPKQCEVNPADVDVTVDRVPLVDKHEPSHSEEEMNDDSVRESDVTDPLLVKQDHTSPSDSVIHELKSQDGEPGSSTQGMNTSDMIPTADGNLCDPGDEEIPGPVIFLDPQVVQEQPIFPPPFWPPGLEDLLEVGQLVTHKDNLRHNLAMKRSAIARMEMVDETRRVRFYVEREPPVASPKSFSFNIYNKEKQEVCQVISTATRTCLMCRASWHCLPQCHFQAMVFAPAGNLMGFVRRTRTMFVQEFEILNANEDVVLVMRGGQFDLELYSPDLEHELGRLAVHGWHGIMHELRRSREDIGITFPMDLDVRVKIVLVGAVFAIDWLYSTQGGRR